MWTAQRATRAFLVLVAAGSISGCGGRRLDEPFVPSVPQYLKLTEAREALLDHLSPAARAQLDKDPVLKRQVLESRMVYRNPRAPFVVVDADARRVHPWFSRLPDDLRAPYPHAVKAVVLVSCAKAGVGAYMRGKKEVGKAYREKCLFSFYDLDSRTWLGEDSLFGEDPENTIMNRTSDTGSVPYKNFERLLRRRLELYRS